mgnify:CR=1 FL=1
MTRILVATTPEPAGIPYRDDRYAKSASPQSIRAYLAKAQARQRAANCGVAWLTELLDQREAEVAAGTWPPPKPDANTDQS